MTKQIKKKLETLPKSPGVYFHKSADGEVLYIGKAAVLRNRVRQYFQKSRNRDPKTEALVAEIADIDWIELDTEIDALFLEAEMIRRYMPRYNILLRDDKSLLYVRIDIKSDHPTVTFTRRPLDDKAAYFGPYIQAFAVRKALRLLRRIFPYAVTKEQSTMGSKLYEQIGLDPGLKSGKTTLEDYRRNLKNLMSYLRGNRTALMKQIEKDMKLAASNEDFEKAAALRNKLVELKSLKKQVIFSDREFMDLSKDKGLLGLAQLLSLPTPPQRIEGYDISHMSGTDNVASMVVFKNGIPEKAAYRKFKMRLKGNNDFAHMQEVISRRLSQKNIANWGVPNLLLIDGGKGQLRAAIKARDEKQKTIAVIGLAKREEEIIIYNKDDHTALNSAAAATDLDIQLKETDDFSIVRLPQTNDIVKLLQRIRDESHRFAVSYHSTLKQSRQTTSWLDGVPGIGPATKRKLIREFGSSKGVLQARDAELERLVGKSKMTLLKQYGRVEKKSDG